MSLCQILTILNSPSKTVALIQLMDSGWYLRIGDGLTVLGKDRSRNLQIESLIQIALGNSTQEGI